MPPKRGKHVSFSSSTKGTKLLEPSLIATMSYWNMTHLLCVVIAKFLDKN